ncbi:MFS transporter [Kribbella solani]|uniref:MFS transporter n=1 Tax=Kribbella solani TaxID=236067 RepID=UPI0029ADE3F5|nr:MFS transporter [Kribbella solani]MDX2971332.1 MFS transporter [Kribbella solani]MDX3000575.1 MFS transporter [Kribbella solani]
MRKLFAQPGFPLLFGGLSTSMLGDSVMLLVLSMWVKTLTGSNAMAGLTFFFMVLPALGAPLLGLWVDRLPRKAILVWGNFASAVAVLPLVLVRDAGDVWLIWVVAFLYGVSFVVLPAAVNGLLKDLLPDELLVDANSSLATIKEGYRLFGPLVGAAIFATAGGWLVAVVDAATFTIAGLLIATIKVTEAPAPAPHSFRDEVMGGVRFLAGDRVLRHVLTGMAISILVIGFFESSIYALMDAFGKPPTFSGVFVTCQGVGAVLGGLTAGRAVRRFGEIAVCAAGLTTLAAATVVCIVAPTMTVVLAGAAICGVGLPWTFVAFTTLMQRRSPRHLIGRVSTAVDVLVSTPQAISLALGSLLVGLLSYRQIFAIIATVILLGVLQIVLTLRTQIRQTGAARQEVSAGR